MCTPLPVSQPSLLGPVRLFPLCFQHRQLPAAPVRAPGAPGLSLVPLSTPELRFRLVARIPRLTVSVCCLVDPSASPPAPPYRWLPLPGTRTQQLPPPSVYLPISVRGFTVPHSYLNTQLWRCSFVEIQMYLSASQAESMGFQDGLVHIQLDSGDQLKKGTPTPPPS